MIWAAVNITTGLIVFAVIVFQLAGYWDTMNWGERIGKMGIAMCMPLRIAPILGREVLKGDSPFDDWSIGALHMALAVYFAARLYRLHRHWVFNRQQKREARAYLLGRGKL